MRILAARWRGAGMKDLTERWFVGARHEVFHEVNRSEVFQDLAHWVEDRVLQARTGGETVPGPASPGDLAPESGTG